MEVIVTLIQSVIIGVIEGITEFLPISSTGHLIIFENIFGFSGQNPHYISMYTYVIQLGAILAVVVLYRKKILATITSFSPKKVGYEKSGLKFWFMVIIACIPGGVFGILLDDVAEEYLLFPVPVAITLFLGAIFMIICENRFRKKAIHAVKDKRGNWSVSPKQAIIIGCFQCLAIFPGMSRSASTIIGGWFAGLSTVAAAEFSFFLAIPVMVGMSALKILKTGNLLSLTGLEIIALLVGFLTAFIAALVCINSFINYLKRKPMRPFAIYRMLFALFVLFAGFRGWFI